MFLGKLARNAPTIPAGKTCLGIEGYEAAILPASTGRVIVSCLNSPKFNKML